MCNSFPHTCTYCCPNRCSVACHSQCCTPTSVMESVIKITIPESKPRDVASRNQLSGRFFFFIPLTDSDTQESVTQQSVTHMYKHGKQSILVQLTLQTVARLPWQPPDAVRMYGEADSCSPLLFERATRIGDCRWLRWPGTCRPVTIAVRTPPVCERSASPRDVPQHAHHDGGCCHCDCHWHQ